MDKDSKDKMLHYKNNGDKTYLGIKIEKLLDDIKKDISKLPCQKIGVDCPQEKRIEEIRKNINNIQLGDEKYKQNTIQPMMESQIIVNTKQDQQQATLGKIIDMQNKLSDEINLAKDAVKNSELEYSKQIGYLITQIQSMVSGKEASADTKKMIMDTIKWIFGILVAGFTIYFSILAAFANNC